MNVCLFVCKMKRIFGCVLSKHEHMKIKREKETKMMKLNVIWVEEISKQKITKSFNKKNNQFLQIEKMKFYHKNINS